ncbi:MAG: tripartite tricarboxylate transporter substrate binding protein [Comamonadaceae bacterium]|uniref:Bug family tripartite tricarboxylate transporter substrate binding protein n=1 Tax=Comamonadaceae TaxID=80864 RepID=UPI000A72D341|nr:MULTISPECIES: tripartite tricarboxylate transporter substrate binding protein [unclassified Hydrogenophaga]MCV0441437.1 tripartite tricarboxylate transporter substrate binding protein [Hydrogenophaga sp.]NCT98689.1 tripartite tricarboxylate transporter substrate binding protein [Comamonadaceae bacterium]NIM55886.1 tripartite tricarboxylate transporter substrate binding protein [Stutzerimonas stutzeri]
MRFLPSSAAAACLIGLIAATSMVHAVETSDKPLRIVVPFAAGGLADVLARTLAEEMRTGFPKGIHVENKTGAGGNLGAAEVFNRPRSSESTIMISSPGPIAINQGLYAKLPYDPSQWLAIGTIASVPNALIVSPNLPIKTAQEFAPYAKQSAGRVSYASQGNGTTSHLTASLFSSLTGATLVHVPYKGDAPALADLSGSQVDAFFGSVGASITLHKSGKVRILAVADAKRSAALPDVPTFAEIGLPGMQSVTWYAAVTAPNTPSEEVRHLNTTLNEALARPAMQERLAKLGLDPMHNTTAASADFIEQQTQLWQKVIRDAKVTID